MSLEISYQQQDAQSKKRAVKACDSCRITKSKCDRDSADQDCRRCQQGGLDCRSDAPVRRKGPEKGYIQRLHELEALVGVLLSSPDPQVRDVLVALSQDPFGSSVLTQVMNGAYGPKALAEYAATNDAKPAEGSSSGQPAPQSASLNHWQLQAVRALVLRNQTFQTSSYTTPALNLDPILYGGSSGSTTSQSDTPQWNVPHGQTQISIEEGSQYHLPYQYGPG